MKISSVSKKVLASALSAAMVVAFAPTVAFGSNQATTTATAKVVVASHDAVTGAPTSQEQSFYGTTAESGLQNALDSVEKGFITMKYTKPSSTPGVAPTTVNAVLLFQAIGGNGAAGNIIELDGTNATLTGGTLTVKSSPATLDTVSIDTITVQMLADTADQISYTGDQSITIDLMGNTLSNDLDIVVNSGGAAGYDGEEDVVNFASSGASGASAAIANYNTLTISPTTATAKVTVKNGTVNAAAVTNVSTATNAPKSYAPLAINETAGETTLDGITAGAGIAMDPTNANTIKNGAYKTVAAAATYKGTVATGAITGNVTLDKAAELTVAVSETKKDAKGIVGNVTLGKDSKLDVTATTSAENKTAVGIDMVAANADLTIGKYTTADAKDNSAPVVKVTASSASKINSTRQDIKGIALASGKKLDMQNGTLEVSAASIDDLDYSTAVDGKMDAVKGDIKVTATAFEDEHAIAVSSDFTAKTGVFTGKIAPANLAADSITGGSFTSYPQNATKDAVDLKKFEIADENGFYVVKQFAGFAVKAFTSTCGFTGAKTAVENYLNGKDDAAKVTLASGVTLADLQKQCGATGDKQLQIIEKQSTYNAKKATEAEKAAYDAFCAYAKDNMFIAPAENSVNFKVQSLVLGYYADDAAKTAQTPTVMATVDTLGGVTTGRTFEANEQELHDSDSTTRPNTTVVVFDGTKVTPLEYAVDKTDKEYKVKTNNVYAAYAILTIDPNAIKDAVDEKPETVEKATQGIDVSKKSRTVKLAKGKTKTAKALYFKMGASAETALTTAKKSGSSRITVSGDKVTLKKGTKKGTYTAKVSLKAAGSAEYLAAAKTITVKFVVKK